MFNTKLLIASTLFSFSAMGVTFQEKVNRVEFLEELQNHAISMDIDAYRRELVYEKLNLSLDKRAENEANLLAEKIRFHVTSAYEAAASEKTPGEAFEEVKEAIEKDLTLVSSELQDEVREIAMTALSEAERGFSNKGQDLQRMKKVLLKDVRERADYLNREGDNELPLAFFDRDESPNKTTYKTKADMIAALTASSEGVKTNSTANLSINSTDTTSVSSNISLRVKASFMGAEINAGPAISFRREYKTRVSIQADGLYPVLSADGNFDLFKKDSAGQTIKKNGVAQKRLVTFACDANLMFETDYSGGGGFSIAGVGGGVTVSKKYANSVGLVSRRITLPESVAGKTITYKELMKICHTDFLKARVTNVMTIEESLNVMMKNVASSLSFSHPKNKCVQDKHCLGWFSKDVISWVRSNNTPRCAEEPNEKYRVCELRGLKGQNCTLRDKNGKRISSGSFEFACDAGLKCVQVKEGGWFQNFSIYEYPKGQCQPIDPKTYKRKPHF